MKIGPLEYVVIGVDDQQLTHALFAELNAIQAAGQISVVDLLFVTKATDGSVVTQEVSEQRTAAPATYAAIADNLMGLLTAQDIEQLTSQVPPGTSAIVLLFEHTWVIGLTEVIRQGGGLVFNGGMVSHLSLIHI